MACARCGANVDSGYRFCPECGAPQSADASAPTKQGAPATDPPAPAVVDQPTRAVLASNEVTGGVDPTPRRLPATDPAATAAMPVTQAVPVTQAAPITQVVPVTEAVPPTTAMPATTAMAATTVQRRVIATPGPQPVRVEELRYTPFDSLHDPTPLIVMAVLTAIAAVVCIVVRLLTIRTDLVNVVVVFRHQVSNSLGAATAGCVAVVAGAAIASARRPVGAGLLGGAGLALATLATMPVGSTDLAYRAFIRHQSGSGTFTHEVAFYVALGTIGLGIITFLVSISYARSEGSFHPGVRVAAIVGLLGTIAVVVGPLIPLNEASWSDNFTGENGSTLSLVIRTGGIVLVLLAGVVGFLNNSTWGFGVALGGISAWVWLWFTALAEMGDTPVGPAFRNPGAVDTKPHIVTTIGIIVILIAAIAGILIALTAPRPAYDQYGRQIVR